MAFEVQIPRFVRHEPWAATEDKNFSSIYNSLKFLVVIIMLPVFEVQVSNS